MQLELKKCNILTLIELYIFLSLDNNLVDKKYNILAFIKCKIFIKRVISRFTFLYQET